MLAFFKTIKETQDKYFCFLLDCGRNITTVNGKLQYVNTTDYMSSAVESCEAGYRVQGNVRNNSVVEQKIVCAENGLWNITGCERKGKIFRRLIDTIYKCP